MTAVKTMSDVPGIGLSCRTPAELRRRTSLKWSRVAPGHLAADVAELDFDVAPPVLEVLAAAVRRSDLGYPDFTGGTPVRLKDAFAERLDQGFGWRPEPARVELCAQVAQALCCAVLAYTEPGDAVVMHAPTYRPLRAAVEQLGRRAVTVPVEDLRDVARLREAVSAGGVPAGGRVGLLVLCQPHNPTGHVFDERTLSVLAEYAEAEGLVVFSDEIHQDLAHAPVVVPAPGATPGLSERLVSFTSAAKSFNIPGLRCAVGHFGSAELHATFCRLPWHLRDGASLLGAAATLAAWEHGDPWLQVLREQLLTNRQLVVEALDDLPVVRWTPPDATYLAWLDLSGSPAAQDPRQFFVDRGRLHLQAGADFGPAFRSFARLNFGTSAAVLGLILDRLRTALVDMRETP